MFFFRRELELELEEEDELELLDDDDDDDDRCFLPPVFFAPDLTDLDRTLGAFDLDNLVPPDDDDDPDEEDEEESDDFPMAKFGLTDVFLEPSNL